MKVKHEFWLDYFMIGFSVVCAGVNALLYLYGDRSWWGLLAFAIQVFLIKFWLHNLEQLKKNTRCMALLCQNHVTKRRELFCPQHHFGNWTEEAERM